MRVAGVDDASAGKTVSGLIATSDEARSIFQQLDLPLPGPKHLGG